MKKKLDFCDLFILTIFLFVLVNLCIGENVKKSADENRDDNGDTNDEPKDESLDIPAENEANITCARRHNSQMHEIRTATHKQFPFMAAVMTQQDTYVCSGSVVSNGLVLTTAQCTQQPISYILLNTTKDKKDETTVRLHITKSERFPSYMGPESIKDVALIYTEKHNSSIATKIRVSNYTNSRHVIDLEALGFGLNADVGDSKELQYVGLEHRTALEIGDIMKAFFDCVDTKVSTCFKDTGGPVIVDNEVIGIVVKGQNTCTKEMTQTYSVNKFMVDILPTYTFKPWLDERIKKNEEAEPVALTTYPSKPIVRATPHKMTSRGAGLNISIYIHNIVFLVLYYI